MSIAKDKPIFDAFRLLTGPINSSGFASIKGAIQNLDVSGSDKNLFDTLGQVDDDDRISHYEFQTLKRAINAYQHNDDFTVVGTQNQDMSRRAIKSMADFEGFRSHAYPDPGSRDGHPWTIGFGSTGPDIRKGTIWTREQALSRMTADIRRFEDGVERAIGSVTTNQDQFDAFVHFAYNVGIRAFSKSTLLKKHKAGDIAGAADEFLRWNKNDGKVMKGLVNRRAHERALYLGEH